MLSTQDIAIVKSTVPLLEQGGSAITQHFYQRMFRHNPELNDIFNMSNQHTGRQVEALFQAIAAYAQNIDNLAVLQHMVERIAHKHTSFHIKPDDYKIVGHHLIETLRELLPEQFTEQVERAWGNAYQVLANIFINREEQLYSTREQSQGGWRGKRAFALVEKTPESELVTSFVFKPIDCQPVLDYAAGQYLGIELKPVGNQYNEIRQYSLSTIPNGESYRISVKRETGKHQGVMSNYLHDQLNVGDLVDLHAPTGDFFLEPVANRAPAPIVLISAGVGVTPMQAMLEQLNAEANKTGDDKPQVHYLHACINSKQHSFKERSVEICQQQQWPLQTWYQEADTVEQQSDQYERVYQGFIDFEQAKLPLQSGHFYLCGPVGFMRFAKQALLALGVDGQRIHYEVFGPHADL